MGVPMKITLEQTDFSELLKLALSELRTPESQLLFILRKELSLHNQGETESASADVQDNSIRKEVSNGN